VQAVWVGYRQMLSAAAVRWLCAGCALAVPCDRWGCRFPDSRPELHGATIGVCGMPAHHWPADAHDEHDIIIYINNIIMTHIYYNI
jgi:hypothetical protein